jgi:chemotaxis protein methyltransferase CheR
MASLPARMIPSGAEGEEEFAATGRERLLGPREFNRLSRLVGEVIGIKMPPEKRVMLEARLRKRLRALGMADFAEYADFLESAEGREEVAEMVDAVTTNKTDFFREPAHFDFLRRMALPWLVHGAGWGRERSLRVWSAGCATGEEAYTLAMVLAEFGKDLPRFDFSVLGTDISRRALAAAFRAVYREEAAQEIPWELRRIHLLRSRDRSRREVRVAPELRCRVSFLHLNFMEDEYRLGELFPLIFLRNVLIYFDRSSQEAIVRRVCRHLSPDGYFFLGHSETLNWMDLDLVQVAPMVYRHPGRGRL